MINGTYSNMDLTGLNIDAGQLAAARGPAIRN